MFLDLGVIHLFTNIDAELITDPLTRGSFSNSGITAARMDIRPADRCEKIDDNGDYIDPPVLTLTSPRLGNTGITLDSDTTPSTISVRIGHNALPPGVYVYDIVLKSTDEKRTLFAKGVIEMFQGATDV